MSVRDKPWLLSYCIAATAAFWIHLFIVVILIVCCVQQHIVLLS